MTLLSISIVLYKNSKYKVLEVIKSALNTKLNIKLYLIDNSLNDSLKELTNIDERIVYIFNNANLGYRKAHNIAMRKSIEENAQYHLVLNPNIYFQYGVLEELYNYMEQNKDVGLIMPKVLYPDGSLQYLCKLIPTPFDLLGRSFLNIGPFKKYIEKRKEKLELRFTGYKKIINVSYLSGFIMFIRTEVSPPVKTIFKKK